MEAKQIVAALESGSLEDHKTAEAMAEAARLIVAQQARIEQLKEQLVIAGCNCVDDFIAAGCLQSADSTDDFTALRAHDENLLAPYQRDTERLEWLLGHPDATICSDGVYGPFHIWFRYSNRTTKEAATAREAIDAAIEKGGAA